MKASELMIGNLFYPINRSNEVNMIEEIPFIVCEISQTEIRGYLNGKPLHQVLRYDTFSIRDVSSIPLTEEWLKRFGFEKSVYKDETWFHNEKMAISDRNGWYSCRLSGARFISVHQLQNLYFALTGTKLELK